MIPVILCGGSGTRLWPLSRQLYPKQFLPLIDDATMVQATVARLKGAGCREAPIIVSNEEHRFMVAEQLRQVGEAAAAIILEPVGRNTAPAIAVAALEAMMGGEDPVLLVLPADHVIRDTAAFAAAVAVGAAAAGEGELVTFGIVPHVAETGYGYIRADKGQPASVVSSQPSVGEDDGQRTTGNGPYPVAEFVEKPDRQSAEEYLAAGTYYWNSGMFMFKATRYLEELEKFSPEIMAACRDAHAKAKADLDFLRLDKAAFEACPANSIDYAVMEKTDSAVVVPLDAGWSDVGSWSALWEVSVPDRDGNVLVGDVLAKGVSNSYVRGESRLVAVLGLDNHVVVETPDAVLVARKDQVQDVKEIVNQLKVVGRDERLMHRRVHRPWGTYEGICTADRFQVKRIVVNPGARLSLQMHHHRAEHWIIVKGTARVTRGEHVFTLGEDQSTYIPLGTKHRLENPGRIPLELIEVQTGSYLGEDDIVRFEDVYGRSP